MTRENRRKKSSSKKGPYLRHGTLSRNAIDYADLEEMWNNEVDLEQGQFQLKDLTSNEKDVLVRLRSEDLTGIRNGSKEEKALFVKRLPTSIRTKRLVRSQLQINEGKPVHLKNFRDPGRTWNNMQRTWRNIQEVFKFWSKDFKTIEAEFGSGVLSYFIFLRWLLSLNFRILLLIIAFIVIPQTVLRSYDKPDDSILSMAANQSLNFTHSLLSKRDLATYCSALYHQEPHSTRGVQYVLDFIQGTGWMERTLMFYGEYSDNDLSLTQASYRYSMPLAYLLVIIACFFISIVLMSWRTREVMHMQTKRTHGDRNTGTVKLVFCSWDYTLTNPRPVRIRHKSIYMHIMAKLEEEKQADKKASRGRCEWACIYVTRILINLIILAILAVAAYLIYFATSTSANFKEREDYDSEAVGLQLLIDFVPSLTITFLNFIIPMLLGFIVKAEKYNPTLELNMTLGRTVFLRLSSLAVLFATLYYEITCGPVDACSVTMNPKCSPVRCWETYTGQQIYRLIVVQVFVETIITFLVDFPRRVIVSKMQCAPGRWVGFAEFNIPKTVLDLIYCQTLFWIGSFFAPLTSVISVIFYFLLFYLKKLTLMNNYQASKKPYRSSRSHTFFMVVLMTAFILCCVPVGYSIWVIAPSRGCGPFRVQSQMWAIINETVDKSPPVLQQIFSFLFSVGFALPLFVVMSLALYWYHAINKNKSEYINILTDQLALESRDKHFLLGKLNKMRSRQRDGLYRRIPADDSEGLYDQLASDAREKMQPDLRSNQEANNEEVYDNAAFNLL